MRLPWGTEFVELQSNMWELNAPGYELLEVMENDV